MSRKLVLTASTFGLLLFASCVFAGESFSGNTSLKIEAVDASERTVRGQEESKPGFFERIKRSVANWARDDEESESPHKSPQVQAKNITPSSVPMTPPKPVTASEVRDSSLPSSNPDKLVAERERRESRELVRERSTKLEQRMENAETTRSTRISEQDNTVSDQEDVYTRLERIRKRVLLDTPEEADVEGIETATPVVRRPATPQNTIASPERHVETVLESPAEQEEQARTQVYDVVAEEGRLTPANRTNQPAPLSKPAVSRPQIQSRQANEAVAGRSYWNEEVAATPKQLPSQPSQVARQEEQNNRSNLPPVGGINIPADSPWNHAGALNATTSRPQPISNQHASPLRRTASNRPAEPTASAPMVQGTASVSVPTPNKEKAFLVSPLLEVETEGDSKVIVGQESVYRIRLRNRGGAPAEQVILTVDVPNWIDILPPDVSTGTTAIIPKANQESRDFTWKISRVESMAEEQLVLHLVPQSRKTVDLRIKYDFHKNSAVARIEVQEPIIEMELQGPNEVLWGSKVGYKLFVRNTGNGDAEKVNLELLQTGSDMKSCPLPILRAGDEQIIDVDVWTGKQDHIDINILATGAYDLTSKVSKRVTVLKPDVTVSVESTEVQFVDSPAEFLVIVRNDGTAPATNLELTATVPLGARYVSNNAGGKATPQNQVVWKIPTIPVGEEFAAVVVCEPKREGECKLDAVVSDGNGLLASCSGTINAEAIADLKMEIENPQGPVEVGQEAVFTISILNRGTKTAENVEIIAAFARGLEPFAVEGANGTMNDGQVVFDKIPAISGGQTITLKVKGKADRPGNHRMRTEVICPAVNTHLIFEQMTYFYQKYSKNQSVAEKKSVVDSTSAPLSTARREEIEPQPLRKAPLSSTTVRDDPFLIR